MFPFKSDDAMRSLTQTIRAFAKQLVQDYARRYSQNRTQFREHAASILKRAIPGPPRGRPPLPQVTRASELVDQYEARHGTREGAWKEIFPALHVQGTAAQNLLRERVRSRKSAQRRRKTRAGFPTPKNEMGNVPSIPGRSNSRRMGVPNLPATNRSNSHGYQAAVTE
jgi:hypothetical protein